MYPIIKMYYNKTKIKKMSDEKEKHKKKTKWIGIAVAIGVAILLILILFLYFRYGHSIQTALNISNISKSANFYIIGLITFQETDHTYYAISYKEKGGMLPVRALTAAPTASDWTLLGTANNTIKSIYNPNQPIAIRNETEIPFVLQWNSHDFAYFNDGTTNVKTKQDIIKWLKQHNSTSWTAGAFRFYNGNDIACFKDSTTNSFYIPVSSILNKNQTILKQYNATIIDLGSFIYQINIPVVAAGYTTRNYVNAIVNVLYADMFSISKCAEGNGCIFVH